MSKNETTMSNVNDFSDEIQVTLCFGNCGWYVEWFIEDETAPLGFRTATWYGSREACEARMKSPPPELRPIKEARYVDAATATGMYDP